MATCESCNAVLVPEGRFCTACGAPALLSCPHCGAEHAPNAAFCGSCGTALDQVTHRASEGVSAGIDSYFWIGLVVLIAVVVVVSLSGPEPSTEPLPVDGGFDLADLFGRQVSETFSEIGSSLD